MATLTLVGYLQTMDAVRLLHFEVLGFLCALNATLAYRALTGRLMLSSLLSSGQGNSAASAERVQLLLATIVVSVQYLLAVAHGSGTVMPDVGRTTLILFGGSGGVYAAVKAARVYLRRKIGRR